MAVEVHGQDHPTLPKNSTLVNITVPVILFM